jgi:hypothetical protein
MILRSNAERLDERLLTGLVHPAVLSAVGQVPAGICTRKSRNQKTRRKVFPPAIAICRAHVVGPTTAAEAIGGIRAARRVQEAGLSRISRD